MSTQPSGFNPAPALFNCMPFPLFQEAVNEVQNNTQAPLGLVISSALSAAAMVVQGLADVELASGSIRPTSLMIVVVADPGERKSTVENCTTGPIREFEEEMQLTEKKQISEWKKDHFVWEAKRRAIQRKIQSKCLRGKCTAEDEEELWLHLDSEPIKPPKFKILYEDSTVAAMYQGMHDGFPYVGLSSSEGGAILKGSAFNDLSKQNAIWSGDTVTIDRATRPSYRISGARSTSCIMVQPAVLQSYLDSRGEQARGSGLMSRCLFSVPGSTQGTRMVTNGTYSWENLGRFSKRIKELLRRNVQLWQWGKEDRDVVRLSPDAKKLWLDYYNYVESQIQPGGCYFDAGDHASKLAENAGRIAAVIHIFEGFEGDISHSTLSSAIEMCKAYSNNFMRLFSDSSLEYRDACLLSEFLGRLRDSGRHEIPKNYVRQYGPNALRSRVRLDGAISLLCRSGEIEVAVKNKTAVINLFPL